MEYGPSGSGPAIATLLGTLTGGGWRNSLRMGKRGINMRYKWLAMAAFAGAWALPAQAQIVRGQDPETLVRALQKEGYSAKLGVDKVGDPMITSGVSGTTFQVYFYNCTDH